MEKRKNFNFGARGWILIIYTFLSFFAGCTLGNSVNLLAPIFAGTRGWNAALITSTYTIATIVACVLLFFINKFLIRKSVKKVSIIAGVLSIVSAAVLCFCTAPWQFVVIFIIMKVAMEIWLMTANGVLVGNWFPRSKGAVMGIATFGFPLGSGIGMVVMMQLFPQGWFMSFLPFLIIMAIAIVINGIFLADYPEEKGCFRDNDKTMTPEEANKLMEMEHQAMLDSPWTMKEILTTRDFWFNLLPSSFLLFSSVGMMTQVNTIMMAANAEFAGKYMSVVLTGVSIAACFGSWIIGILDNKLSTKTAMIISEILMIIAGVFMMTTNIVLVLIGIACMAFFMGAGSNFNVSVCAEYWGRSHFGNVFALLSPIVNLIAGFGPMVLALIFQDTGSYFIAFGVVVVMGIAGVIMLLLVKKERVEAKTERLLAAKKGQTA